MKNIGILERSVYSDWVIDMKVQGAVDFRRTATDTVAIDSVGIVIGTFDNSNKPTVGEKK